MSSTGDLWLRYRSRLPLPRSLPFLWSYLPDPYELNSITAGPCAQSAAPRCEVLSVQKGATFSVSLPISPSPKKGQLVTVLIYSFLLSPLPFSAHNLQQPLVILPYSVCKVLDSFLLFFYFLLFPYFPINTVYAALLFTSSVGIVLVPGRVQCLTF